jgi:UDP-2,4-diacetamido-2,4,6-trideoxy-beta-L-altropyranose hydrolase
LLDVIRDRGHAATVISTGLADLSASDHTFPNALDYAWETDARQSRKVMEKLRPDWLVVDHYGIDERWEAALRMNDCKIMVIDDLADRKHFCHLLLDQNLGRSADDYRTLVTKQCTVLTGPNFAIIRSEFSELRAWSLLRRQQSQQIGRLLISFGGVDAPNATCEVLQVLKACSLPAECRVTVVMGLNAQWINHVRELAKNMPWATEVLVNIEDMAVRMGSSDLAIGAAGGSSWERCCMGLPTMLIVLAQNQEPGAKALEAAGAAHLIGWVSDVGAKLPLVLNKLMRAGVLSGISTRASAATDGCGTQRVLAAMGLKNV